MTKDISAELDSVFDMLFYGFGYFFELLGSFEFHGISLFDFVIAITLLSAIIPLILTLLRVDTISSFHESRNKSRAAKEAKRFKEDTNADIQEILERKGY